MAVNLHDTEPSLIRELYDSFIGSDLFQLRIASVEYRGWDTHRLQKLAGQVTDEYLDGLAYLIQVHFFVDSNLQTRDPRPLQSGPESIMVKKVGTAELAGKKNDSLGPRAVDLVHQCLGKKMGDWVSKRTRDTPFKVAFCKTPPGIVRFGDIVKEPTPAKQQIVIDDTATRLFQGIE